MSRSSRWTIPGRSSSSPPAVRPSEPVHERAGRVARRRVDDDARPACRRRAGARPRRRSAAARPPRSSSVGARSGRLELDAPPRPPAGGSSARRSPSTSAAPSSSSRSAAPREPTSGSAARKRSSRSPAASAGTTSLSRQRGRGLAEQERDEQDRDADDDEAVGEVERRPVAQVEEVGDVPEPDPVDQVRGRAADQQAERDRQHRVARAGAREEDEHPADRQRGQQRHDRRRAREEPEGDPGVLDVVDRERADHVQRPRRARAATRRSASSAGRRRSPRTTTAPRPAHWLGRAASERSADRDGRQRVRARADADVERPRGGLRHPRSSLRLQSMHCVVHGSASSRSSPIGWPQVRAGAVGAVVDALQRGVDRLEQALLVLLEL